MPRRIIWKDEGLIDGDCCAPHVACARRRVIGIDLPEDLTPLGQIIEDHITGVGGRSAGKDRLKHRRDLPICRWHVFVETNVVYEALGIIFEPALERKPHRQPSADNDVFGHHAADEIDHRLCGRDVARLRETGASAFVDCVGDVPRRGIDAGGQHLRAESNPAKRRCEMELCRGQQFDAVMAIVGRTDLVEVCKIDFVIAQVELARVARFPLKLQCTIKIACPNVEATVSVAHPNRVIDHLSVDEANADRSNGQIPQKDCNPAPRCAIRYPSHASAP